jgi:hypothetical protein
VAAVPAKDTDAIHYFPKILSGLYSLKCVIFETVAVHVLVNRRKKGELTWKTFRE